MPASRKRAHMRAMSTSAPPRTLGDQSCTCRTRRNGNPVLREYWVILPTMCQRGMVCRQRITGAIRPGKLRRSLDAADAQRLQPIGVANCKRHGLAPTVDVVWITKRAAAAEHLRDCRRRRGDDGPATRQHLRGRQAETFVVGWKQQGARAIVNG